MFLPLMLTLASLAYEPLKFTDYSFIKSDTLEVRHLVEFASVGPRYRKSHRYMNCTWDLQISDWRGRGNGELCWSLWVLLELSVSSSARRMDGGLRPVYVYLTEEEVKGNKPAEEYPVTLEHQTNQNFIFNMSRFLRCLRYFYTKK